MSKQFIGVQKNILDSNEKNLLVSAGAGRGKTTIMIEKISDLLLNKNVDVENLLVVTFTVLAAEEMKDRLISALTKAVEEKPNEAERILTMIENIKTASIDTIDGFSSKTIKKYFYELEISPNIEIVSDATRDYYLTRAMKKTIEDFSKNTEQVNLLLDILGGNRRNFDSLEELIIKSYNNIISLENPMQVLDNSILQYEDCIASENVVNKKICFYVNSVKRKVIENHSTFTPKVKDKLKELVSVLDSVNIALNLKHNLKLILELNFPSFSSKEKTENLGLNEVIIEINKLKELKKELEENKINLNFEEKNAKIKQYLLIFIDILKNFIKNYTNIKEKNNFIDFNDLNRLMLKLLNNEKIKTELQNKYKYIFIDEYQDVNPLQDSIMSSIVNGETSLFMVGDVKQSIYGFRGADPDGFLSKYNNIKNRVTSGEKFDMNVNFRSNPIVLEFINEVFSKIMVEETADINYLNDCVIEPQRKDIVDSKVTIALFGTEAKEECVLGVYSVKEDKGAKQEYSSEAKYVLQTITNLIGTKFYDANAKVERELTYKDIAILSRSEKDEKMQMLVQLLKENFVPLNVTNKIEVSSSETIKLILSILKCVVGVADDVDYLATFMSVTNLTIDELVEIRNKENTFIENLRASENENVKFGFKVLQDIKINSYTKSNTELINYILNEVGVKYYLLRQTNGEKEVRLLEEYLTKISLVEDSLNLAEFIDMLESNISKESDVNSKDSENCVTIQTIHKSKGLEYPVVILYNASKKFNYLSDTNAVNFNADLGFGFYYYDKENRTKSSSIVRYAINELNSMKGYKEEMRLLYVALTRAKNKLYITGSYTKKALEDKVISKNSYTNMLLDCFINNITEEKNELKNCVIEVYNDFDCALKNTTTSTNQVELIGEGFKYKNEFKFSIPFKNSVTSINSKVAQEKGFTSKQWFTSTTQYNAEEDKALIGTHYHKALEMLDFTKDYEKNTNFEDVDYAKIELAHKNISKLAINAIQIKKEAEFMMYVPYNSIVDSEVEDKVLIQGVVDLIIEKENSVILVDYKFSSLPSAKLKEKYCEQLNLYKKAIELAYKKPVEQMYIYSINNSELV